MGEEAGVALWWTQLLPARSIVASTQGTAGPIRLVVVLLKTFER